MIAKVVRMLVGRSLARKRGYGGAAGAAAGLLAPFILKHAASLARRTGAGLLEARRQRRSPVYLRRIG